VCVCVCVCVCTVVTDDSHCENCLNVSLRVCLVQLNSKVLRGVKIIGVCTQQLHTVLCSKDTVYTFGQNAGQLGNLS